MRMSAAFCVFKAGSMNTTKSLLRGLAPPHCHARHRREHRCAEEGQGNGTAGVLSHSEDRRTLHFLQRSGAERRPHDSVATWSSVVVADVSAAADKTCRQISSRRARLSRLRTERLAR